MDAKNRGSLAGPPGDLATVFVRASCKEPTAKNGSDRGKRTRAETQKRRQLIGRQRQLSHVCGLDLSTLLCRPGRSRRNFSFPGEPEESEILLQIWADRTIGMAEVADGNVLANVQFEVVATSTRTKSAGNSAIRLRSSDLDSSGWPIRHNCNPTQSGSRQHCANASAFWRTGLIVCPWVCFM